MRTNVAAERPGRDQQPMRRRLQPHGMALVARTEIPARTSADIASGSRPPPVRVSVPASAKRVQSYAAMMRAEVSATRVNLVGMAMAPLELRLKASATAWARPTLPLAIVCVALGFMLVLRRAGPDSLEPDRGIDSQRTDGQEQPT